jgi:hypothetical protein
MLPSVPRTADAGPDVPNVLLQYSDIFDLVCSKKTKYEIRPEWTKELKQRLPELDRVWRRQGPVLMRTAVKLVGRPFRRREFSATLSLCSFPPMSHPLLLNMRRWLRSFTKRPWSGDVVVGILFHELLHSYLMGVVPRRSPLMKKYKAEPARVRFHLHLLALQRAVYLHLGWKKKLDGIIFNDIRIPGGLYKRAWTIVNEREDHGAFVKELKR